MSKKNEPKYKVGDILEWKGVDHSKSDTPDFEDFSSLIEPGDIVEVVEVITDGHYDYSVTKTNGTSVEQVWETELKKTRKKSPK